MRKRGGCRRYFCYKKGRHNLQQIISPFDTLKPCGLSKKYLLLTVRTIDLPGKFATPPQRGQKKSSKNSDNSNNNQKFYQCERSSIFRVQHDISPTSCLWFYLLTDLAIITILKQIIPFMAIRLYT